MKGASASTARRGPYLRNNFVLRHHIPSPLSSPPGESPAWCGVCTRFIGSSLACHHAIGCLEKSSCWKDSSATMVSNTSTQEAQREYRNSYLLANRYLMAFTVYSGVGSPAIRQLFSPALDILSSRGKCGGATSLFGSYISPQYPERCSQHNSSSASIEDSFSTFSLRYNFCTIGPHIYITHIASGSLALNYSVR